MFTNMTLKQACGDPKVRYKCVASFSIYLCVYIFSYITICRKHRNVHLLLNLSNEETFLQRLECFFGTWTVKLPTVLNIQPHIVLLAVAKELLF